MELVGVLLRVKDVQIVNDKFRKREFVIQTQEQYPEHIPFEFVNEQVGALGAHKVGDVVRVHFTIKGRDWTPPAGGETKTFVTLRALSMESLSAQPSNAAQSTGTGNIPTNLVPDLDANDDDLPF